jgi:hypothetical protein
LYFYFVSQNVDLPFFLSLEGLFVAIFEERKIRRGGPTDLWW